MSRLLPQSPARLLVLVGFLGGYTTFSTFSLEALALWQRGLVGHALAYMGGSLVAGFAAVALGVALGGGIAPKDTNARHTVPHHHPAGENRP